MRRLLATALVAVTLLTGSACAKERTDSAGAGASPTPTGPSATVPAPPGATPGASPAVTGRAGGNADEVCAAAVKLSTTSAQTYFVELGKLVQASAAGDTKAAGTARTKAESALRSWATGLREQAAKATDPQLKAVLTEVGTEVAGMRVDVESIDEQKLEQLRERLDVLCGR